MHNIHVHLILNYKNHKPKHSKDHELPYFTIMVIQLETNQKIIFKVRYGHITKYFYKYLSHIRNQQSVNLKRKLYQGLSTPHLLIILSYSYRLYAPRQSTANFELTHSNPIDSSLNIHP